MADPPTGDNASATPPSTENAGGASEPLSTTMPPGDLVLKNTLDVPDDSLVYDRLYSSPMRFISEVVQARSTPNGLRNKQRFYGRFIMRLFDPATSGGGPPPGDVMWDPVLSGLKKSNPDALTAMQLFVGVVHIAELQSMPFPREDDWDSINKIAMNGGIFKSYVYTGEQPKYGDNVLVTFADLGTRTEGIFLHPMVGGQAAGAIGADGNPITGGGTGAVRGSGPSSLYGSCRERPRNSARRPATSQTTPPASQTPGDAAPATPPAPPAPSESTTENNTPRPRGPNSYGTASRCDRYGKPIHWKRSGQKNEDLPQLGPDRVFGIDVSKWNAERYLKWDKLKNIEGCEYCIIKLSEGNSAANPAAQDQYNGAKGAGMFVSPYHFCRSERQGDPIRNAKREFENFKSLWKSIGAWDITPALDFESGRSRKRGFSQPAASIHNMKFYLEFSRLIKAETGNYPLLYTAPFARSAFMNGAKSAAEYTEIGLKYWLWWAEYDRTSGRTNADAQGGRRYPTWKPWSGYDIWQFSGWGRFESLGGQGRFDFNSMKKSSLPKIKWGASATPSGFSGTT